MDLFSLLSSTIRLFFIKRDPFVVEKADSLRAYDGIKKKFWMGPGIDPKSISWHFPTYFE